MKISNAKARPAVQTLSPFTGNNTFGEWSGSAYTVFSYGHHFPLFVFKDGIWYENSDKYSVSATKYSQTTSKHRSQLHPLEETVKASTSDLQRLY